MFLDKMTVFNDYQYRALATLQRCQCLHYPRTQSRWTWIIYYLESTTLVWCRGEFIPSHFDWDALNDCTRKLEWKWSYRANFSNNDVGEYDVTLSYRKCLQLIINLDVAIVNVAGWVFFFTSFFFIRVFSHHLPLWSNFLWQQFSEVASPTSQVKNSAPFFKLYSCMSVIFTFQNLHVVHFFHW